MASTGPARRPVCPTGRIAAGEARAQVKGKATGQSCVDCHGADGNKPIDPTYPKLGGQYGDYLAHALQAYRAGDRQHALMTPQATDLSDQDIADLAAYFGSRRHASCGICTGEMTPVEPTVGRLPRPAP